MKVIAIDHYNQTVVEEVSPTLKRYQGGDDYIKVLIIDDNENSDRKEIFRIPRR